MKTTFVARWRCLGLALGAGGLALAAGNAHALLDDRLELYANEAFAHDDNIYRLADAADTAALLGSPQRGDRYRATSVGFNLRLPVSLQRIEAGAARTQTRHQRFKALDLDGYDSRAVWHWQLDDLAVGELGGASTRSLGSLADRLAGAQSQVPNFVSTRRLFARASNSPSARWRLRAEGERLTQRNSADERKPNDLVAESGELGIAYTTPPGNSVGLLRRHTRGALAHSLLLGGLPVDNSYRLDLTALAVDWSPSALTQLRARAGHLRRTHDALPQRDFGSPVHELTLEWKPSALLRAQIGSKRELSTNEDANIGAVLVNAVEAQLDWRPSEPWSLALRAQRGRRTYLGDPAEALGLAPARRERASAASLSVGWRLPSHGTAALEWRHERRDGGDAASRYGYRTVTASLRLAF